MDINCECQQKYVDYSEYDELGKVITPIPQIKTLKVDFGKVAVCKEYVKTIEFEDINNTEIVSYKIKKDSVVKRVYQVFTFNKYEGKIKPKECLNLKIKYSPQIPFQKNLDTFVLVVSSSNLIKIILTGETKGPQLRISVKHITFSKTPFTAKCKRTFEVKNISDVPAEFIFDCNEEDTIFKIEPMRGTIQGRSHLYVEANFLPNEFGFFSQKISCLCWCDVPFAINLFGIYLQQDDPDMKVSNFKSYPFPFEETVGYDAYFKDANNSKDSISPISLNRYFIDFGRTLKEYEAKWNNQPTTMENLTNDTIIVRWPKDDIFTVVPRCIQILYNGSVKFDCYFNPKENNAFYSRMVTAQIDWKSYHTSPERDKKKTFNVPITATVRLQGHSFPEGECWISNVEIDPPTVVLPPCLLGETSSANFKIYAIGHLPVMYRIMSPKKTNIVMKPMVGVINSYAIVAVQLYTTKEQKREVFNEQWYVVLNGREEKRIPLCVKGETGIPEVLIGYKDNIRFESVNPGCETFVVVSMKNISSFEIRFLFDTVGYDCIELEPMRGFLTSNEETTIKCKYTGNRCIPNKISLKCKLQTVQKMEESIGEPCDHLFFVHTKCVYSELCATPNRYSFGRLRWGSLVETEFHLFNFGESVIHFQLSIHYHSHCKSKMKINPKIGEVHPGGKMKISISIHATTIGSHKIDVSYGVRKNSTSDELISEKLIYLYEVQYSCTFPKLQVEEIVEHNFGPLFAKTHFWRYLEINRLNELLRLIKDDETTTIFLNLPNFEVGPTEYYITLLVKNITIFDMDVQLKREQMCYCPLKEIPGHINIRKKAFECIHREMLTMELTNTKFYKKSEQLLTIRVKYSVPGENKLAYSLDLGDTRKVEFVFTIFTIPQDNSHISLYKTECQILFKHISVCRRVAPIQTIWLYNNTKMSVPYKLDESEFTDICWTDGFEVFKCVNPEGEVEPYSSLPLMIKFHPIEVKRYEVIIKLLLGDRMVDFSITATGLLKVSNDSIMYRMPVSSKKTHKFPVTLSVDYMSVDCLPVWSTTERVIFMKNISKDKLVQYTWHDTIIDGVMEISTATKSGMLRPRESRPILIRIKSFNEACVTDILLTCKMLDYVQFVLHKKSLELYNIRQEQVEAEFTVTEEGSYHEPNEIVVADLPEVLTISLCINVNIIHTRDRDEYMHLNEQFKSTPHDDVSVNVLNIINDCFPLTTRLRNEEDRPLHDAKLEDKDRINTILEELIADFVFCKSFEEMFKTSSNQIPPFYNQFTMMAHRGIKKEAAAGYDGNLQLRKQLVRKVFSRPKLTVVNTALNELIKSTVIELFKLGLENPTEEEIDQEVERILKICTTLIPESAPCKMD